MSQLHQIELTYFKESGKFYASGTIKTELELMYEIDSHIKQLRGLGRLPGLIEGAGKTFYIHVDAWQVPNGYPLLIMPLIEHDG